MHPVNFLFEDIYRNDWAVQSQAKTEARRGRRGPWARDPRLLVERKRA